jgi:hypothetical protein
MQTPTSESLEALVRDANLEEQLAAARQLPTSTAVQLPVSTEAEAPAAEAVSYVPAPKMLAGEASAGAANGTTTGAPATTDASLKSATPPATAPAVQTALPPVAKNVAVTTPPASTGSASAVSAGAVTTTTTAPAAAAPVSRAELLLMPEQQEMRVGEKRRVMLMLKTDAPLGLATATLRFDPRVVAVRSVSPGTLAADKALTPNVTQSIDPKGVLLVSLSPASGAPPLTGVGLLLIIEFEGLAAGESAISFDADKVHLIATDGRNIQSSVTQSSLLKVTQ